MGQAWESLLLTARTPPCKFTEMQNCTVEKKKKTSNVLTLSGQNRLFQLGCSARNSLVLFSAAFFPVLGVDADLIPHMCLILCGTSQKGADPGTVNGRFLMNLCLGDHPVSPVGPSPHGPPVHVTHTH